MPISLKSIDRSIAFQRCLAGIAGGHTAGLFLSQCVYWSLRTKDPDGWFFKTVAEWKEETMLTESNQETARKHLREKGYLYEKREGGLYRIYFKVDVAAVEEAISVWEQAGDAPFAKTSEERKDTPRGTESVPLTNGKSSSIYIDYTQSSTKSTTVSLKKNKEKKEIDILTILHLPTNLQNEKILVAAQRWWNHRRSKRWATTENALKVNMNILSSMSPEIALVAIDRAIKRGWQKIWPLEQLTDLEPEYEECLLIYREFYKKECGGVYPPDLDDKGIIALNEIIRYLKQNIKNGSTVADGWAMILGRHRFWEPFYQKQTKVEEIQRNLQNIIVNVKTGQQGGNKSLPPPLERFIIHSLPYRIQQYIQQFRDNQLTSVEPKDYNLIQSFVPKDYFLRFKAATEVMQRCLALFEFIKFQSSNNDGKNVPRAIQGPENKEG